MTFAMASRGFEPSLDAVKAGGAGVEDAFTSGLRIAFLMLGSFNLVSVVLTFLKPSAPPESDNESSTADGRLDMEVKTQPGGDS